MQNQDAKNNQSETSSYDVSYDGNLDTKTNGGASTDPVEMSMGSMEGTSDTMTSSNGSKDQKRFNKIRTGMKSGMQNVDRRFKDRPLPYVIGAVGVGAAIGAWLR